MTTHKAQMSSIHYVVSMKQFILALSSLLTIIKSTKLILTKHYKNKLV